MNNSALSNRLPTVAYFSMEIGIDASIPTYSGGLGVLAGDTLSAAADFGIPMVAITLLYRKGYFRQQLDQAGSQTETPYIWSPEKFLDPMLQQTSIEIEGREVKIRAWRLLVNGIGNYSIPIYFLDTDLPENCPEDRALSGSLYGGDSRFRLCQETLLGIGGNAMLKALGYNDVQVFHMNEGHSSLLTIALLEEQLAARGTQTATEADHEVVRQRCIFTTHTPIPAGHDQFPAELAKQVLGKKRAELLEKSECLPKGILNMTQLALFFSRYVNGVAMQHGAVSRNMFPNYPIDSITNGVHTTAWASPQFSTLFDQYIPNWRRDNFYLRHAINIPLQEIHNTHLAAKRVLLAEVAKRSPVKFSENVFTIGFARRSTTYKRADLLFTDIERLKKIANNVGALQIIYAGKAHPKDDPGKKMIQDIFKAAEGLQKEIPIVYLEEYDMQLAKKLCAGVDVWLNTPRKPQEASGTSGMKAALNGVPSFSILDGWWIEGHTEGITGWAIGGPFENRFDQTNREEEEVESLYEKLEKVILPLYYQHPEEFDKVRQSTIASNGSFFSAQRMVLQYLRNAYLVI